MANFLINSSGQLTEGTSAGELFLVQTAGESATTIQAAAGNDTIQLLDDAGSASENALYGQGGGDLFELSGTTYSASSIFGGAGGDTIIINSATNHGGDIKGGAGSDDLTLESGGTIVGAALMGKGADDVVFSASFTFTTAQLGLGAGKDTLEIDGGSLSSTTINGGGGNDYISAAAAIAASALQLNGGNGNDEIDYDSTATSASTINGGAGLDTIEAAFVLATAAVLGGGGADSIFVTEISGAGATVGGGSGNDTIDIDAFDGAQSAQILAGGGADSIELEASVEADFAGAEVYGGAGADSISLVGNLASGEGLAYNFAYAAYSDSTETEMDFITIGGTLDNSGDLVFTNDSDTVSAGVASATAVTGTGGIFSFSATSDLSSVSERVAFLDSELESAGDFGVFLDQSSSAGYLFIQGGATDLVVKIANDDAALTLNQVGNAGKVITLEVA